MNQEQLDDLIAKMKAEPDLVEQLEKASDQDDFLRIAQEAGFDLNPDMPDQELDDDELEEVSAGARGRGSIRDIDWCRVWSGPTCTYISSTNTVGTSC
jgi:predicted ribosomally synthesized peptide with nif11-like leader